MAVSETQIANRALQKLGAARIESLTQNSPNARSMAAAYAMTRDAELRRYDWSFAIKRDSIAADANDTSWGGWKRYGLPNDFARLIRDDETQAYVDWRIEGRYIVTADDSPLKIRYIARVEDPNLFDPLFIEALACKLALETCEEITQSTSKKQSIKDDYDIAIAEARRLGAIEKPAQEFNEDPWLSARR
jgi:hypothetical protein